MRIVMTSDSRGAPKGSTVVDYVKGQEYDVPDALAEAFIKMKVAAKPGKKKAPPPVPGK